jgi:hypothetical protein
VHGKSRGDRNAFPTVACPPRYSRRLRRIIRKQLRVRPQSHPRRSGLAASLQSTRVTPLPSREWISWSIANLRSVAREADHREGAKGTRCDAGTWRRADVVISPHVPVSPRLVSGVGHPWGLVFAVSVSDFAQFGVLGSSRSYRSSQVIDRDLSDSSPGHVDFAITCSTS